MSSWCIRAVQITTLKIRPPKFGLHGKDPDRHNGDSRVATWSADGRVLLSTRFLFLRIANLWRSCVRAGFPEAVSRRGTQTSPPIFSILNGGVCFVIATSSLTLERRKPFFSRRNNTRLAPKIRLRSSNAQWQRKRKRMPLVRHTSPSRF